MQRTQTSKKATPPASKQRSPTASKLKAQRSSARAGVVKPAPEQHAHIAVLPRELRDQVDRAIAERPKGLESVRKIHDHFKLESLGITLSAFSRYVRRAAWRARLGATGRVVDAMFGSLKQSHLERASNSAVMHLITLVSQSLQGNSTEIPTSELAKLSKIIAEQRASNVKEREVGLKELTRAAQSTAGDGHDKPQRTGLPENFDEVVRRIYGVEFEDGGGR